MVFRLSTTKIISRPIDLEEETAPPEKIFVAIDTYIETSRKDEFILGNLFDYNGDKIDYIWDSKKNQVASLKSKNLSAETIILATDFLNDLYVQQSPVINTEELSNNILNHLKELQAAQISSNTSSPNRIDSRTREISKTSNFDIKTADLEENDQDFIYDYENDPSIPVFTSNFLEDDEEVDDFDEQLALKSQEFLKEHPEAKSEMEIVRLLEGN